MHRLFGWLRAFATSLLSLLISLAAWFGELALRLGDHRCQRRSVGVIRSFGSHPSCRFWNARTAFVSFRIIDDEIGFRSSFKKATDLGDGEDAGHFALCPRLCGALPGLSVAYPGCRARLKKPISTHRRIDSEAAETAANVFEIVLGSTVSSLRFHTFINQLRNCAPCRDQIRKSSPV